GAEFGRQRRRAEANRTGYRHYDVGALVAQVLGEGAAVIQALEVVREKPLARVGVPAEHLNVGAFLLIVMLNAAVEAVHEDRHRRNVDAAEGADDAAFRNAGREVTGKKGRFIGVEDLAEHVRYRR